MGEELTVHSVSSSPIHSVQIASPVVLDGTVFYVVDAVTEGVETTLTLRDPNGEVRVLSGSPDEEVLTP